MSQGAIKEIASPPDRSGFILAAALLVVTPWLTGGKDILSLLVVFAGSLLVLALAWRARPRLYTGKLVLGLYAALMVWATASQLWSVNRYESQIWLLTFGLAGIAFQFGYALRGSVKSRAEQWLAGYQLIALATACYGAYLYVFGDYNRLTSTFYWPNPLAIWLIPAILIGAWWAVGQRRLRWLPVVSINLAAFALANSRTSILLLGISLVAMAGIAVGRRRPLHLTALITLLVVSAVAFMGLNYARVQTGRSVDVTSSQRFTEVTAGKSTSLDDRINYLRSAAAMWTDKPILGWGAGTYGEVHPKYQVRVMSSGVSAHNTYAQTFAELGVVGGLLLIALLLALLYETQAGARREGSVVILIAATALLLHLGVDIDARYPAVVCLAAVVVGLTIRRARNEQHVGAQVWTLSGLIVIALVGSVASMIALVSYQHYSYAGVLQEGSRFEDAQQEFKAAHSGLIYDPASVLGDGAATYASAFLVEGQARVDRLREARSLSDQLLGVQPRSADAYFLRGRALRSLGDLTGSEEAYRQAIELDPYNRPDFYYHLGDLLLYREQPQLAITMLDTALPQYDAETVRSRAVIPAFAPTVEALYDLQARAYRDSGNTEGVEQVLLLKRSLTSRVNAGR